MTETHRAATLLVERSIVRRPLGVLHVQLSARCERLARPTVPGRQHAVKHVDTSCYCFDEIFWRADAHQITRPFVPTSDVGQVRIHPITKRPNVFGGTPEGQAKANEDSWGKLLAFLEKYLRTPR